MKRFRRLSTPVFLALFSFLGTAGAEAGFVYLRADSIDLRNFPRPPSNGSTADRVDLDGVRRLQGTRTNRECSRATDEAKAGLRSFYGMSHAVLTSAEIDLVQGLFDDVGNDSSEFVSPLKQGFARPRPFQRDPNISICVPVVTGFSYPSGHSTLGRVSARVLALLFPKRAQALLDRGNEIGYDRVLGGVHHPRDIQAGQILGDEVFDALIKSPKFMHRISQIRAELPRND